MDFGTTKHQGQINMGSLDLHNGIICEVFKNKILLFEASAAPNLMYDCLLLLLFLVYRSTALLSVIEAPQLADYHIQMWPLYSSDAIYCRYDGQTFVKPPEVLARDRLLGSYEVQGFV